jgi:HEAT repeat protein
LSTLVRRKEGRAVERLIVGLGEAGPWREVCAWALGMIGDPAAFEPLRDRIHDDNPTFQMAVVKALRTIDNARAVELLHERLDDAADPGRDRLARTLAALDLMGAIGSLCRKVKQGSVEPDRLRQALAAVHAEAERGGRGSSTGAPIHDPQELLRRSAAAMRRLEADLRNLAQDP